MTAMNTHRAELLNAFKQLEQNFEYSKTDSMSQEFIDQLCKDSPEFASLHRHYQALSQQPLEAQPRVIVCGMYNAGKSSLLNVLTEHLETECFKTGAARVTAEIQSHEFNGITLIDTPGIDGSETDDSSAWEGIINGDFYLYAHNVLETEFSSQETNFLQRLSTERPDFHEHHLLVLTQADRVSKQEELEERAQAIKDCFKNQIKVEPETIIASSLRYKNGVLNNKSKLRQFSGIDDLKNHLNKIKQSHLEGKWAILRKHRHERIINELTKRIEHQLESKISKKQRLESERNQKLASLQNTIATSFAYALNKLAELKMA
ncbi:hypothetical protein A1507_22240 [Methylomonas koyamae]|uniref:G domain-containing protein n=1 Tax=Methylomonas koyamae TaxID=702114 RepID=A0A177NSE3_9GAMM|nr:GTPase [Methylomonas koyamae]OAI21028.1 hypothetical protein A1507_22240 [Methylomonas koyamae]